VKKLVQAISIEDKIAVLDREKRVWEFCAKTFLPDMPKIQELVIKSVVAIGQNESLFSKDGFSPEKIQTWMDNLVVLEEFYKEIGGIVGYHLALVQFLCSPQRRFPLDKVRYHAPVGYDLSSPGYDVKEAIYHAIDKMDGISEMYPVGGAADRLKLQDPSTKECLPAALLVFLGKTMLEHLLDDVKAREYLYYKIKGEQIRIPVAMMTSQEKDNHRKIVALCEQNNWFSRSKDAFFFFSQPSVPVVDKSGNWICIDSSDLLLKPGGHGVIWKLARDSGVIEKLQKLGAKKAIIRQINNPISSEDYGLLAFSGYGLKENRRFGFASCERQVKASEGVNVIVEEEVEGGFCYSLTSIEYCDFATYGIEDVPAREMSPYSKFPSNTNLLFADFDSILEALKQSPIPGMLANFKKVAFLSPGGIREEEIGRLESTMQNIADCFKKCSSDKMGADALLNLDSYITFNARSKTISVTKKEPGEAASPLETPEGCFLDVLRNKKELLESHCGFTVPDVNSNFREPSFLFLHDPALGPLYSVIRQKIFEGSLTFGSELELRIAECDIKGLALDGSLRILANRITGEVDEAGILRYSEKVGRCTLKNVSIRNLGIDRGKQNIFWQGQIERAESCEIILQGESELIAENVMLVGNLKIVVEDGLRLKIEEVDGKIVYTKEKLDGTPWIWRYKFSSDYDLELQKVSFSAGGERQ